MFVIKVKYEEMRPRAKVIIPFTDLDIGMDIMVNYNMEKHEERGWSVEENAKKGMVLNSLQVV